MSEGAILDPYSQASAEQNLAALRRRVDAGEQRPKVVAPAATMVRPIAAGFGGFWNTAITGAAFQTVYRGEFEEVTHQALFVRLTGLITDVGTTAEARVSATLASGAIVRSAVNAIGSGGVQIPALGWIHGLTLSAGDRLTVDVEARTTSGAGNVYVYMPVIMQMDPQASTPAGAWYSSGWLPWP